MTERILPAYPLFVKDPNFSLWGVSENLNESNVQSWWGAEKKIYGFIRTEGETYCFLGNGADFKNCGVQNAHQTSLAVSSFSTDYEFTAGNVRLKVRFVSPLSPEDLSLLALPVCYMEYEIQGDEKAELSVFVNRHIAYNDTPSNQNTGVRGGVMELRGFESAFMGLRRQLPLSNNGDSIGADWGYYYLSGEQAYVLDERDLVAYLAGGFIVCPIGSEADKEPEAGKGADAAKETENGAVKGRPEFLNTGEERYMGSFNCARKGAVMLGYDDLVSIDYFGRFLKGYYLDKHTITEALEYVYHNRGAIDEKLAVFDQDLKKRAEQYGQAYYHILCGSLRQSISAHKLVKDTEGNVLFLSKENCSNGCIATVDVSYPSMPLYLLYNTELVKGMMRPILKFADMPVWPYDFAPHDVGTYPACCGQVYGLNLEKSKYRGNLMKNVMYISHEETHFPLYLLPENFETYALTNQMPVEECANMLIMLYACYHRDGDTEFFRSNISLAEKWVEYLVQYGLKPENQLCTDDFAGHLKNNINLAIKATVGIAAYAGLTAAIGAAQIGEKYKRIAEDFAAEITVFGERHGHLPLTWDSDESTFSLKYNLAFDKIWKLGLFPQSLLEREVDCYLQRLERYGVPLDSRADYTKSDWLMWAASLTDDTEKKKKLIRALDAFLKEAPERMPFGDWYGAKDGLCPSFRARSVVGGCFVLLL